jgi:hypothetical protein
MAHTCNLSYSGGRDWEDCGWKPAWANSSRHPISKIPLQKSTGGMAQNLGSEFKPQYCKKQKNEKKKCN